MSDHSKSTLLDRFVAWLGYSPRVLNYLIVLLLGVAYATQLFITSGGDDIVALGNINGYTFGIQVLSWLPAICFATAAIICGLQQKQVLLIGMGSALLVYGVTHGTDTGYSGSAYWAWGVVLALGCLLFPAIFKIGGMLYKIYVGMLAAIGWLVFSTAKLGYGAGKYGWSKRPRWLGRRETSRASALA